MGYPAEYDDFELEVRWERSRQHNKWGEQNHPDGTGGELRKIEATQAKLTCDIVFKNGAGTWMHILKEEVQEAFAESDPIKLKTELIQVAAVCKSWIEAIDRRPKVRVT